jgi:hypothetical protein
MYIIACCKCGKLHRLENIRELNWGRTWTPQGYIQGMTTSRLIKGQFVDSNSNNKKNLSVCCEPCYDKWQKINNSALELHKQFFEWIKDKKFASHEPFIFR